MEKENVVAALSALAQNSRLDVFRYLVTLGPGGAPAGDIAAACGLAPTTLSFHLKEMKFAGLITGRREGRSLIYSANYDVMNGLIGYLTENCCAGDSSCLPTRNACT